MFDTRILDMRSFESLGPNNDRVYQTSEMAEILFNRKKSDESNVPVELRHNPLVNFDNYGPYQAIAHEEEMVIDVQKITAANWDSHYQSILNILKDGIYSDFVQRYKLTVKFGRKGECKLSIIDYYFNLIMWRPIVWIGEKIQPKHIYFEKEIRAKGIKAYLDEFVIEDNRIKFSNLTLSNIISDTLYYFHDVDQFSNYLCNTLNLEDTVDLMEKDPDFDKALHGSYNSLQVDQVKGAIMKNANLSIDRIRNSKKLLGYDHCLADAWRASEGINPKQYAEFTIAIGIKPDGRGGIFPEIVNSSFIGGGLVNPVDYFIESSTSRIAQILKFKNVSKSGTLARIMGLNNMDSYLYPDSNFDCRTVNLVPIQVKSADHLKFLNLRYYRENPLGQEKLINYKKDSHLIGKTIFLRSPCTCASAARGHGICYKCYGNLAYSVYDAKESFGINIGRIAAELITSKQTQKQLSAKHILEASVDKIEFSESFDAFFEMENTVVRLNSEFDDTSDYKVLISQDSIESDSDYDNGEEDMESGEYDEYITEFEVVRKSTGEAFSISTISGERLFITNELNGIIRKKASPTNDKISIPMNALKDCPLFFVKVQNNELIKILNKLKNLYNRSNEVRGKTIHELLQEIMDTNIEGDMGISAVHYEVILSNQIRDDMDVLERPDWNCINPSYRILTLDEALTKNPSVTVSLSYQKITKALYDPLTYKKNGASFMDLFFMGKPQLVIRDLTESQVAPKREPGQLYEPIVILDDPNSITAENSGFVDDGEIIDVEE